jgi:hypothetical protein
MKVIPTIIAATAIFTVGAGHASAWPPGQHPPLVAEMARTDWKPSLYYAPSKPHMPRPDWLPRSTFPPLVAEMHQRDWRPEVQCGYSVRGVSSRC